TSFIQITATFGLFISLLVILGIKWTLGDEKFNDWGWRVPFLLSSLLLAVSVYIRMQLAESPVFKQMKAEGKTSKAPLTESFARWSNLKLVILALLGATAGQAVVWYCGQFYAMYFLGSTLKIDATTTQLLIAGALLIGTPFFVVFGWLSDKIGRKPVVLAGCLLAALTYFPIFKAITHYGNPGIEAARNSAPVIVQADPARCHLQINLTGTSTFTSSCDIAKSTLAKRGVPYDNQAAPAGSVAKVMVGNLSIDAFEGGALVKADFTAQDKAFAARLGAQQLPDAGVPAVPAGALRDHGLRPDRGVAGGNVPDQDSLHLDEPAVSHRQRLVRRLPALGVVRHRGAHRQHLRRPVVSGGDCVDDVRGRPAVRARDEGRGHHGLTRTVGAASAAIRHPVIAAEAAPTNVSRRLRCPRATLRR